ncbi:hypothetical protein PC128_g13852 [Phytophthora cactorum]|nr:hypothetical protein PC128_g13852 [Phytophthora cactorum]
MWLFGGHDPALLPDLGISQSWGAFPITQSCRTIGPAARAQPRTTSGCVGVHPSSAADTPRAREVVRRQTASDYRSNKALILAARQHHCRGYGHLDALLQIAVEGVRVRLRRPLPKQASYPSNHPSASTCLGVLRANIRKEHALFHCIVVVTNIIDIWPELFISPFDVVDKGDGDPRGVRRVTHDLSFPKDNYVNANTDPSGLPWSAFEHCSSVVREILRCKRKDQGRDVMVGDIASAYRNACTHSECVYMFAWYIPGDNAIMIDMSATFGWTGSAGTYSTLGGAVAFTHGSAGDGHHPSGFYNYHLLDDHVNVAADVGSRCDDIERSLRHAMTPVMDPTAVNDQKLTSWSTHQKILGLIFDMKCGVMATPASEISKAQQLVTQVFHASSLSRFSFRPLLGTLRNVATCVRPAQAFLQRLRVGERNVYQCSQVRVSETMRADLLWWWHILSTSSLNGISLEYFDSLPEPDIIAVADATDAGACAQPKNWLSHTSSRQTNSS